MPTTNNTSRISQRRKAAIAEGGPEYAAKRAKLVQTAAVVFREKGYTTATLNDVAERFGTDRASLYYYVGSKEDLLYECISTVLDANLEQGRRIAAGPGTVREKLTELVTLTLKSYEEHYPYAFVYIQEDMSHIAGRSTEWAEELVGKTHEFERLAFDLVSAGIQAGEFRSDLPTGLVTNGLFGMMNWTHRWFVPGHSKHDAAEIAGTFLSIFLDGMART
ncbi:TetR/AcrR family transcriptional regulator [Nocardioides immobilis]|uniref:TetR/AcrR family transcriptional regulator n=1 Tax=Nocardioides immobilis TaxID=2049295 RepID=UPI0015FC98B2|nr:TetR/AcrR family transcriptional regulator [Nocardioides immobilis]